MLTETDLWSVSRELPQGLESFFLSKFFENFARAFDPSLLLILCNCVSSSSQKIKLYNFSIALAHFTYLFNVLLIQKKFFLRIYEVHFARLWVYNGK